jgi:hypothetical protein
MQKERLKTPLGPLTPWREKELPLVLDGPECNAPYGSPFPTLPGLRLPCNGWLPTWPNRAGRISTDAGLKDLLN